MYCVKYYHSRLDQKSSNPSKSHCTNWLMDWQTDALTHIPTTQYAKQYASSMIMFFQSCIKKKWKSWYKCNYNTNMTLHTGSCNYVVPFEWCGNYICNSTSTSTSTLCSYYPLPLQSVSSSGWRYVCRQQYMAGWDVCPRSNMSTHVIYGRGVPGNAQWFLTCLCIFLYLNHNVGQKRQHND